MIITMPRDCAKILSLISHVKAALEYIEQHLPRVESEDPAVAKKLKKHRRLYSEPQLEYLKGLLQEHFPDWAEHAEKSADELNHLLEE